MKISVFGNSNTIMLTPLIRKLRPQNQFVSLAIGGSSSPSHLMQLLLNLDILDGCKIAIIEPVVIDYFCFKTKESAALLRLCVVHFLHELVSRGIYPVLVILPPEPATLDEEKCIAAGVWEECVERVGGMIVDLHRMTRELAVKECGIHNKALWREPTHHIEALHQWYALVIAEAIAAVDTNILHDFDYPLRKFYAVGAREIGKANNIEAKNRYSAGRSVKSVCVPLGRKQLLITPPSSDLCLYGLLLNWGRFNGSEEITLQFSTANHTENLKVKYFNAEKWELMLGFHFSLRYLRKDINEPTLLSVPDIEDNAFFFSEQGGESVELAGLLWGPIEQHVIGDELHRWFLESSNLAAVPKRLSSNIQLNLIKKHREVIISSALTSQQSQ